MRIQWQLHEGSWGCPEFESAELRVALNEATARSLARRVRDAEHVLCVGTPTVFKEILDAGRKACLVDQNPLLTAAIRPAPLATILTGGNIRLPLGICGSTPRA